MIKISGRMMPDEVYYYAAVPSFPRLNPEIIGARAMAVKKWSQYWGRIGSVGVKQCARSRPDFPHEDTVYPAPSQRGYKSSWQSRD